MSFGVQPGTSCPHPSGMDLRSSSVPPAVPWHRGFPLSDSLGVLDLHAIGSVVLKP
ncbi:hypothetical protein B0T18DRAFT_404570 [Schizothecium vesticola]|uniref:Uncharacterized protein n=1 Tax=Schizothecium vesticola TaxID=314040 RepID=A0AA40F6Z8_9PEZI|nr:hypothetical protein B0T18DRAFT_404570 [Schizothecium vesticola]